MIGLEHAGRTGEGGGSPHKLEARNERDPKLQPGSLLPPSELEKKMVLDPSDLFLYAVKDSGMNRKWGRSIEDAVQAAIEGGATIIQLSPICLFAPHSLLGPEKIIGVSCKTLEQAQQAYKDGANYIGSGGIYPTNTKENNLTIGLEGLKAVCLSSKLPVVAISGIGISNAHAVMELGLPNLMGIAVVSALFDRECISTKARKLHEVLWRATSEVK
ncbi:hypothetical protein NL676_039534 [Syzygium grande]|nr:hypothetical protein NL676_039534 [Syzygium grande]